MQRVSCIRTTLEASNYRIVARKYVYNLSFAFVSPLETEHYVKFHMF